MGKTRQVLILRHGKAEKSDGELPDRDRRLLPRGRQQCESMARQLVDGGYPPDYVLSSPALRARETAGRTIDATGLGIPVQGDERLYDATPRSYLSILQDLPEGVERVLVVGHNPTVEEFVEHATGREQRMKTAYLAVLETELPSWRDLAPDTRFRRVALLIPDE